ncbi:MAG: M48 family metallopeptidase [Bacteroides sp.]|nr:M48 family metallopeptidase [Bacteroides sp.]
MKEITDKDFGKVFIRENNRARQIILRVKPEGVYITTPPAYPLKEVLRVLEQFREKLVRSRKKIVSPEIDPAYSIDGELFRLKFIAGQTGRFLCRSQGEVTEIIYPPDTYFEDKELQAWLRKVITELLRKRAKIILPVMLEELSRKSGLSYHSVKITSGQSRWGSCSSQKHISLSLYLVLLPLHLVEYILLHELCHTVEMNHSAAFWNLLDRFCQGRSRELRSELKNYHTGF